MHPQIIQSEDLRQMLNEWWRLAWIISESFRQGNSPQNSYNDFCAVADAWASRFQDGLKGIPQPWVRDGIQAEMAVRDYIAGGNKLAPSRNVGEC